MDYTYAVDDWVFGQMHTGGVYCEFVKSKISNPNNTKYKSPVIKHVIDNIVSNNAIPYKINKIPIKGGPSQTFIFSNAKIYFKNDRIDKGISKWILHSDDGAGHFILKLYRNIGYVELDIIKETNLA